jgi:uncharacterized membrane protein YqjE
MKSYMQYLKSELDYKNALLGVIEKAEEVVKCLKTLLVSIFRLIFNLFLIITLPIWFLPITFYDYKEERKTNACE